MTTVNRPTNVKQKDEDVNQKLQLYGIYSGKYTSFAPCNTIAALRNVQTALVGAILPLRSKDSG